MAAGGPTYKGVPLADLRIDAVHWTAERVEHIRTRTRRYAAAERDLEPEWATEAALDPWRLVRVTGNDEATRSLAIVGFAPSVPPAGEVLKVWVWSDDPARSAVWNGGSAAVADRVVRDRYWRERRDAERP